MAAAQQAKKVSPRWVPRTKKQKIIALIIMAVIVILVAAGLWWKWSRTSGYFIEGDKYQAVYLTDDKVYFGKLDILNDGSYKLTNVYYPQAAPAASDKDGGQSQSTASSQLVKFGSELLGGEDQIIFSKQRVSYWVNLKSDSKVVKAIDAYIQK